MIIYCIHTMQVLVLAESPARVSHVSNRPTTDSRRWIHDYRVPSSSVIMKPAAALLYLCTTIPITQTGLDPDVELMWVNPRR